MLTIVLCALAGVVLLAMSVFLYLTRPLSVMDCGARGDAETDDTAAIQECINKTGFWRRAVYFPRGTYRVGSLTLPDTSGTPSEKK